MRNPSMDQEMEQRLALTVRCRHCGSRPNEVCTTTDLHGVKHPLVNFPAHLNRIRHAERQQRLNADRAQEPNLAPPSRPEGNQAAKTAIEGSERER
ncbi:zinc finger domain-containing protein [Rhodococcus sp. BH5]|uniref:zinc finger domain-containing protein n=1 Tax=Rhodococcus sp. BH5 TaxID=2871702 RepID=UPI0022CD5945|nr:hypothetical protein [Rhodococcus sp. BH5]MCZ9631333.1 hypothetical protein [Rhodococcus sp. BH5]